VAQTENAGQLKNPLDEAGFLIGVISHLFLLSA
jgi:hypothetical protein